MDSTLLQRIDALIRREVVPATGCTEPASIALGVAYAASILPARVSQITVRLSANMIKNAMGVGIPGTGMIGIPIAIALGAVIARPERGLQVLEGFDEATLAKARALVEEDIIDIQLCQENEVVDKLYAEAILMDVADNEARSIIEYTHTGIRLLTLGGQPVPPPTVAAAIAPDNCGEVIDASTVTEKDIALSYALVYDYAMTAPLEMLEFIYAAALTNKEVGTRALSENYGHSVGRLIGSKAGRAFMGHSPLTQMIATTSAACDARMGGAPFTVMSNSGSGNQGITATLPVLTFAETQDASYEQTVRALMLSSLMVVYIKQYLGRLSGLCGMVVSGIGSSAALVYLMGGTREQSSYAIMNMVGNVTGMICDGAKPSCSLKASTGIGSAMIAALLAMEHGHCTSIEGIVHDDVDACIRNLAFIGREAMQETDRRVLELMMNKSVTGK